MKKISSALFSLFILACSSKAERSLTNLLNDSTKIEGKKSYLGSPYVTAGNRLYMVGHQDGTFPALGWHIKGEMGGIWNHPIKLMDGFEVEMAINDRVLQLNKASEFVNYPYANKHVFEFEEEGLVIERIQFVPDNIQGILIQFVIKNNNTKKLTAR